MRFTLMFATVIVLFFSCSKDEGSNNNGGGKKIEVSTANVTNDNGDSAIQSVKVTSSGAWIVEKTEVPESIFPFFTAKQAGDNVDIKFATNITGQQLEGLVIVKTASGNARDTIAVSQAPNPMFVFTKTYGGSRQELFGQIGSLSITADNGYLFTGTTGSNDGDVTGNPDNIFNAPWIVKTDASGTKVWAKVETAGEMSSVNAAIPTQDNGAIGVGISSEQNLDGWIFGIDADGVRRFDSIVPTTIPGYITSFNTITRTSDGNYVAGGELNGQLPVTGEALLAKVKENGEHIWQKTYGRGSIDEVFDQSNGNIIAFGHFGESLETSTTSMLFLDNNGMQTSKTDVRNDMAYNQSARAIKTSDNNFVFAQLNILNQQNAVVEIVKLNSAGETVWSGELINLDPQLFVIISLAPSQNGGFVAATGEGVYGFDGDGTKLWRIPIPFNSNFDGPDVDYLFQPAAIIPAGAGSYALYGFLTVEGGADLFLMKVRHE